MNKIVKFIDAPAGSIVEMVHKRYGKYSTTGEFYKIDGEKRSYDGAVKVWKRFNQGSAHIYKDNYCMVIDWNSVMLEGF
jgi:hypothetical protein